MPPFPCFFPLIFSFFLKDSVAQVIETLINGVDLSEEEAEASLKLLIDEADEALISAFLVLLRVKGETFEEVCLSI